MTFSTARPILERLAFVGYLALLICSLGITGLGWIISLATGNFTAMWIALGGLALSRWLHVHGHAHWHFQECEDSFDVPSAPGVMPRPAHEEMLAAEIATLFVRMEAEGDVWARGDVRREIAARLAAAPALRADFAEALATHPEL